MKAAGILFVTLDKQGLFIQRAKGDHLGEWCFPGGGLEGEETAEEAAIRECKEEVGWLPEGERAGWTRQVRGGVDFTTFIQQIDFPFIPTLNSEHSSYAWAPINRPPQPL